MLVKKIVIMCGGIYQHWKGPKAMSIVRGERLIERTIRLLKENGITDWSISSNNDIFEQYGKVLYHPNSFVVKKVDDIEMVSGYWIDAYYPTNEPTIYLHGDVYYTEEALKKILNYDAKENTFIGNEIARNPEHKNWGEPFGWIVVDQSKFREGIEKTKRLQDEGKLQRGYALSWELYRVLEGTDPNYMLINDNTYLSIDDSTIDVDTPEQIELVNRGYR
jgi:NDP-sugar pyrophosphorylase family protein